MKLGLTTKILQNRVLQHTLFWTLSYFILVRLFAYGDSLVTTDFIYAFLFHIPLVIGVYLHLHSYGFNFLVEKNYAPLILRSTIFIPGFVSFLFLILFKDAVDYIFPGYYFISYYQFKDYYLFALVYIGITTLLKLSKSWFELENAKHQISLLKEQKLSTELQALKGQINPHFLFNSLNSIYSLSLDNEKITPKIILKLSDLLRFMLYEANEEKVSLKKELNYLENYIEIQKLRVPENTDIQLIKEGDIHQHKIVPLLLIPLVENGFKHGIKGDIKNAFIHISYNIINTDFIFSVKNNKGYVDEVEGNKFKGIGLKNVKRRLELLYPNKHEISINDLEKEFQVQLKIDLS